MMSTALNSENTILRPNKSQAIVKGNMKTSGSSGLTLRNMNTNRLDQEDGKPIAKSLGKDVKVSVAKPTDDDEIEYMHNVPQENDDYGDIIPIMERATAKILRKIFWGHGGKIEQEPKIAVAASRTQSLNEEGAMEEISDEFEACSLDYINFEEITDDFEPCSLEDVDFEE